MYALGCLINSLSVLYSKTLIDILKYPCIKVEVCIHRCIH